MHAPQQALFKTEENFHLWFYSLQLPVLRVKAEKRMLAFYYMLKNGHWSTEQCYNLNLRKKNNGQEDYTGLELELTDLLVASGCITETSILVTDSK